MAEESWSHFEIKSFKIKAKVYLFFMIIYHGIVKENFKLMLSEGLTLNSYWGELTEAQKYTDCSMVIKLDTNNTDYLLMPNNTLIEYYENSEDSDDQDLIKKWNESNKTWEDSLRFFGSVLIEEKVFFDESDIVLI